MVGWRLQFSGFAPSEQPTERSQLGGNLQSDGLWTYGHDLGPYVFLDIVFGPLLWMVLATLVVRGVRSIGEQLVRVRSASRQNTQAMAESFSKLVLREVWLAELRLPAQLIQQENIPLPRHCPR